MLFIYLFIDLFLVVYSVFQLIDVGFLFVYVIETSH